MNIQKECCEKRGEIIIINMKRVIVLVLIAVYFSSTSHALAATTEKEEGFFDHIGIKMKVFQPNVSGHAKAGSDIDFNSTLGVQKQRSISFGISFRPYSKWKIDYGNYSSAGNQVISSTFTFNHVLYQQGQRIKSDLNMKFFGIDFMPNYQAKGNSTFSWLLGLKGYKFTSELNVVNSAQQQTKKTYNGFYPVIGAHWEINRMKPSLYFVEISGLPMGKYGYDYDVELGLKHRFSTQAIGIIGYRAFVINTNQNSESFRLSLCGPFTQFEYRF